MSEENFIKKYLEDFSNILKPNDEVINKIIKSKDLIIEAKKIKQK